MKEIVKTVPSRDGRQIKIHGPEGFAGMRAAGRLAAETLDMITPHVQPGVTTERLDELCHQFIADHGAIAAPLNYRGFPKSICTSVNHVVCHGIPGAKVLEDGDCINIDVTTIVDGWHGDTSRMFHVGKPKVKAEKLVDTTFEAMWEGINMVRPGARRSRVTPRPGVIPWSAISAATAWARCSTTRPTSCISVAPATATSCMKACSSPSSR